MDIQDENIGKVWVKKRNSGQTMAFCKSAYPSLINGGTIGVMGGDVSYVERLQKIFKEHFNLDIVYEEIKRKEPQNNRKLIFDRWGEVIGIEILPQTEIVVGYKIKANTNPTLTPQNRYCYD